MENLLTFLELFVSILMLMSIGLFLAMYSTGDLYKLIAKVRLPKWKMSFIPYKDRPWYGKIAFKLFLKYIRIPIIFKYHYGLIFKCKNYSHIWFLITRKCPRCGSHGYVKLLHQNCSYVDNMSNYYWLCKDCHKEVYDMYQDMWDEYNASRL